MPKRGTNIYKRKDGRWEARYVRAENPDGTKKYASVYGRSYREAKEKQLLCIQGMAQATKANANMLLEDLMWKWLSINADTIKKTTYYKYESMISTHLTSGIGRIPIKNITGQTIPEFVDEKLHGENALSPKTVNDLLVILGMAFSYAEREFGFQRPPLRRVKEEPREMRVLSAEEQEKLEAYLLTDMDACKMGILLALYSGLRIGELCGLQWEDICDGTVTVNKSLHRIKNGDGTVVEFSSPKTPASNRRIPLPAFLAERIEPYRSSGPVLKTAQGRQVEPRLLQMKFKKYLCDCGLEDANFHALRHTFATRCVEAGFDVKTLSEILGHTDVKTTLNRYVHSSFALKQKNMEKLKSAVLM